MYPIQTIRNQFPILAQRVHNNPLVYFDNAATTQKPQCVIDAIVDSYTRTNANIHRGIHTLSQRSTDLYEQARARVQTFINAPHSREIIFTKGVTESLNLLAWSFGEKFIYEGDEIIVSAMEHHSNLVPWQMLCERKRATLRFIPFFKNGELDMETCKTLFNERTKLLSIAHVSNSLGTVNPLKEIIDMAHAHNVPVCVDGAQSIQHTAIDVQSLDCDFFAFSGHKIYAPTGIGVLWGKEQWLNELPPYQGGGGMIKTVSLAHTEYNELPFRFEAGTTNYVGAHALGVALEYVQSIGLAKIEQHENELLNCATQRLQEIDAVHIIGNARHKAGAISFIVDGAHPADVGMILDKKGIAIRTGTHCTEPVMQFYNISTTARISFGMYNTLDEVNFFADTLQKVVKMF
ncbi:MAG: cysteine desulfurase [Bacteroidales bacterium]|jgi:cysteine desulfurase/selenocysteine lyase|nr:cysteine desulfurase [Bacteroidales bacterium]